MKSHLLGIIDLQCVTETLVATRVWRHGDLGVVCVCLVYLSSENHLDLCTFLGSKLILYVSESQRAALSSWSSVQRHLLILNLYSCVYFSSEDNGDDSMTGW